VRLPDINAENESQNIKGIIQPQSISVVPTTQFPSVDGITIKKKRFKYDLTFYNNCINI